MHWQEEQEERQAKRHSSKVVDAGFRVQCARLPVDNAYALQQALLEALPWLKNEPQVAIHTLQGAESGNGWIRPEQRDAYVELPKRARLRLRLPSHRLDDAQALEGRNLDVGGHQLSVRDKTMTVRPLNGLPTVFARHMIDEGDDEDAFIDQVAEWLKAIGIQAPRLMGGRQHELSAPDGLIKTRSLMIDGLERGDSLHLQEEGLGAWRMLGCGIFLPHKDIKAVYESSVP